MTVLLLMFPFCVRSGAGVSAWREGVSDLMTRFSEPGTCTPSTLLLLYFLRDATSVDAMEWSAECGPVGQLLSLLETNHVDSYEMERQAVACVDNLVRNGRISDRMLPRDSRQWPRTREAADDAPGTLAER
jgi:hypothetical protein